MASPKIKPIRSRNKNGKWRRKRSDAGKPRDPYGKRRCS